MVSACLVSVASGDDFRRQLQPFLARHCNDCHADGAEEGGLSFDSVGGELSDAATFARWERIFDRVVDGEMPPADADSQPTDSERERFRRSLQEPLLAAHAKSKGTVLRRLNRREYENTLNDLFGVSLDLADRLPEDGRSHEFDNVGEALGMSSVHLERYLGAVRAVLDNAIAKSNEPPKSTTKVGSYKGTREGDKFIGSHWKELPDGAVVRFAGGGYPSGMMRSANISKSGRYRVTVRGYAYQSTVPVTFSVGGASFQRGSEAPIYGFFSFLPAKPGSQLQEIEFEAEIADRYMIQIEPYGIRDPDRYKRETIDHYTGPGLAIHSVTVEGPLVNEFPSRGHQLVLDGFQREEVVPANPRNRFKSWYVPKFETTASNEQTAVTNSLLRGAAAAFRRPVETSEIADYLKLYRNEREAGADVEQGLRTATAALFCSPRFLYLAEPAGRLDDYAVASRLSYFLSRTGPDDELRRLAEQGRLTSNPRTLRAQVDRLLDDPRFERFITDFCDSWLDLREIDFTAPDTSLYPEFDDYLRWSMPLETTAFVRQLFSNNRPARDLVAPPYAMLNSRLAELYGLPDVDGSAIREVTLPRDSVRGGLLAQASILKVTANGTNTSPVMRGAWTMERIFGETPPPPPPGIPGVEPDIRGAATLRELLAKHRDQSDCNACHRKIDPPGFALEQFNPIGGQRDFYRSLGDGERLNTVVNGRKVRYRKGQPVDSSGESPDGHQFSSFREFQQHLAANDRRLATTLTEKLLTFATGREMGFSDRAEIDRIVSSVERGGYRTRDILGEVVNSEIFLTK